MQCSLQTTENNLQSLLHQFMVSCQNYHMKISGSKTKAPTVSKEPLRCELEIQGNIVEQVMKFKYLTNRDKQWSTAVGSTTPGS
jgi:hypothetical protein